jgi:RimJ/RimL family protein N-acetyltransferase
MTDARRRAWLRVSARHTGRLIETRHQPDFAEIPLATARLEIRRFEPMDLEPYLRFMTDPASTRYLALKPEQETEAGAVALFEHVVASYDTVNPVNAYAIAEHATGHYVGSCGFAPYEAGVVECYYCLNAEQRGKGYAAEAVGALLAELGRRVEVRAFCHPSNTPAHAVAIRAGMRHAGRGRNSGSGLHAEIFSYGADREA